jgi:hypothetical protein
MLNKLSIKQLAPVIVGLMIINLTLAYILWSSETAEVEHLDGSYSAAGSPEVLRAVVMTIVFTIPVLCLLLALLTAIFINKELPYTKRYWKAFMVTLSIGYGLMALSGIFRLVV